MGKLIGVVLLGFALIGIMGVVSAATKEKEKGSSTLDSQAAVQETARPTLVPAVAPTTSAASTVYDAVVRFSEATGDTTVTILTDVKDWLSRTVLDR